MPVTNDFTSSELDLNGNITLSQPTALVWGPDGKLYITEVGGSVKVLTVAFGDPDPNDTDVTQKFYVTDAYELTTITGFNYDDDGTYNPGVEDQGRERQVTGIDVVQQYDANGDPVVLASGKPAVDIYVTSSDPRHGAGSNGEDSNLDTNSGVVHRLRETVDVDTVATPDDAFDTVDLVRGFSRSEENHAINGLEIIQDVDVNGVLISERAIVAVGGNTNNGAPSNNFAAQQEYATSAGIFELDISMLDSMTVQTDAVSGRDYVYDLPTLNDALQDGASDENDPFGGNDGSNQAVLGDQNDPNNPVKMYSPGYRNAYDVEVTDDGRVWTYDNGANNGWGGRPVGEAGDNGNTTDNAQLSGYIATNLNNGDGNANDEVNLENWNPSNLDNFHEITRSDDLETGETLSVGGNGAVTTYTDPDTGLTLVYGGHPNPTRAEGSKAGLLYSPEGTDEDSFLLVSDSNAAGDAQAPSDYDEVIAWFQTVENDNVTFPSSTSGSGIPFGAQTGELTKRVIEVTPGVVYDIYEAADGTGIAVVAGVTPNETPPGIGETFIGQAGLPSDIYDVVNTVNPVEGNYLEAGYTDGSLDSAFGSVNGLAEYTSTILDDPQSGVQMSGAILASTFNGGGLIVMGRDTDGTMSSTVSGSGNAVASERTVITDSGQTLGLATVGDNINELGLSAAFQGSIWAAAYQLGAGLTVNIEIFQPNGVGLPLAGEIAFDDNDKDGDGVDVINDPFEYSADNGFDIAVGETLNFDFEANTSAYANTFANTGFLGAALDGVTENQDAQTAVEGFTGDQIRDGLFNDGENIIPGGNAPAFQIKNVAEGSVVGTANSARDVMQTAVNLDPGVKTLVSTLSMENWIASQAGGALADQLTGMMFSDGTQSNFLRVVFGGVGNGNNPGLEVGYEIGDANYTTLAQISIPGLSLASNPNIDLRLSVRGIGETFDVVVEYKLDGTASFTEVPLNGGAGFQLPSGVLQDVLKGAHTISNGGAGDPVLTSGAAIGILAETPAGTPLASIDFDNLAIEARGNEIIATNAQEVGTVGTAAVDTIFYTGTDTVLDPLAGDVENFDGTESAVDYAVTGNALDNRIEVGSGENSITTGDGEDQIVGTLAQLADDTITDMSVGDTLILTDLTLTDAASAVYSGTGVAELTLNGATITFSGPGFADFNPANGDAVFSFEDTTEGLAITVLPPSAVETIVYRINFGADGAVTAIDGGPDWADDNAVINGFSSTLPDTFETPSSVFNVDYDNVDDTVVPDTVFLTEAGDNDGSDAPSTVNFDVEIGETYRIEYFYTENWHQIFGNNGPRVFDVEVEGAVPAAFDDLDPLGEAEAFVVANGGQTIAAAGVSNSSPNAVKDPYLHVARKAEYIYTATDDTLNMALIHQAQNPKVNAIQISLFGVPSTDALVSIGDTPAVVENGDSGSNIISLPLAVGEPGFTGTLTLDFDVTVNGVTQSYVGQTVNFVDTAALIDVTVPADIQNNGDDIVSVTLSAVAEEGYAIDGAGATGTSSVTEDDAPINPTFPFVEASDGDLSDDRFNPTDLGTLSEGDNLVTATQQGDSQPGGRERDYFTFEVPADQVLTQLILESYVAGEPTGIQGGFLAIAAGGTVELDPTTDTQGQFIPELLGGHVYDPNLIGTDLLPELADGEVYGTTMQGFNLPLGPGVYTIWLNQGGEASTPTINLKTVLATSLPSIAIADAPSVIENGDINATTLSFPVTVAPAEATTLTLSFTVDGGTEATGDVTFDAAGNGILTVDVASDAVFTGTDDYTVTLTGASSATPGTFYVIDGVAGSANGSVTEDDAVPATAPTGDFDNDMILNEDDTDIDGDGGGLADNSTSTDGILDTDETFFFDATNAGTALVIGQVVRQEFDFEGTPFMNGFTGALSSPNAQAPEVDLNNADVSGGTLNISVTKGDHFTDANAQQNAFVAAYTAPEGLSVETRFDIPDFDSATAGVQAPKDYQGVGVVIGTDQNNLVKAVWGRNAQEFELLQDNSTGGGVSGIDSGTTPAGAAEVSIRLDVFIEETDVGGVPTPTAKAKAVATFYDATGAAILGFEDINLGEIALEDDAASGNALKTLVESGAPLGAGVIQTSTGNSAPAGFDVSYQYLEVTALGDAQPGDNAPSVALSNVVTPIAEDTDLTASVKVADITVTDEGLSIVTLALSGDDAGLFEIVDNGGALELHLSAGAALDFETNGTLDVTVEASDAVGTGSASFSEPVGDVNEAPTISGTIADATGSAGVASTVDLSSLALADEDTGDTPVLKVLINGTDVASVPGFVLNGTTLEVEETVATAAYSVEVFATDGALDSASPVTFTVTVGDSVPSPTLTIAMPSEADGDITVSVDFGEPVFGFSPASVTLANTFGLSRSDGTASFTPGDQTVLVTFAAPVGNFAQDTDYTADIGEGAVLDGSGNGNLAANSAPTAFDLDDAPVFTAGASTINLNEETGGVVETYTATDADNDTVSYALDTVGQSLGFTIDPNTGALSAPAGGFDYETLVAGSGTTLTFDIIASSTGADLVAKTATETVSVEIIDQLESSTATFEVEDFDNVLPISQSSAGEFFEENQSAASGGKVARLGTNSNGTASLTLDANDGVTFGQNDIEITYFDESDGVSSFTLNVNGTPVGSVTMNNDGGGNAAQSANIRTVTFEDVTIPENAIITIDGASQGGEFVRLDTISITTSGGPNGGGNNQAPSAVGTIDLSGLLQGDTINIPLEGASPVFIDPDEDVLSYTLSANAPDFLDIVNGALVNTRAITNDDVIASQTAGPVTVTITASDTQATDTVAFDLSVGNVNDAPTAGAGDVFALTTSETAITPIDASLYFDDPDLAVLSSGEVLSYSASGLPASLAINAATGEITGTLSTPGSYSIDVTATDLGGLTATSTISISVTGEPVLGDPIRVQVEDFDNIADPGGFFVENQNTADQNQLARLGANGVAEATLLLDGVAEFNPGLFDLTLGFFDENDGDSVVDVIVRTSAGDELIDTIIFNADSGGNAAQASSFREVTLSGITLPAGATLVLAGDANGYTAAEAAAVAGRTQGLEFVRLDYIDLVPVGGPSDNFAPFAIPGFETTLDAVEGDATFNVANAFGDPEEDALTFALAPAAGETEVPGFLSIDPNTGVVSMTGSSVTEDSQFSFQVTATDLGGSGQAASQEFTLTVTDSPLPTAVATVAASQTEGVQGQVTIDLLNGPVLVDPVTVRLELQPGTTAPAATPGADVSFDGLGATTIDVVIQPGGQGIVPLFIADDGPIDDLESFIVAITDANTGAVIDANAPQLPLGATPGEVTITDADDAPVTVGENQAIFAGGTTTFDPAASDTDADSATLTVTAIDTTATVGGTVVLNGNGTVTVTADANAAVSDISFGYTVEDAFGNATAGTETVTISANALVALEAGVSVVEDGDSGTTQASLGLTVTPAAAGNVDITFSTDGGVTTSVQTVVFDALGAGTLTVDIAGFNDATDNGDDTATITLVDITTPGFAVDTGNAAGVVTITEDDAGPTVALRINAFGDDVSAIDGGVNWLGDVTGEGANQYLTTTDDRGDTLNGYVGDINAIPGGVPEDVLDTARSSDDPFTYSIPVTDIGGAGTYRVNLYVAELFGPAQTAGARVYDVSVEGTVPAVFDNIDPGGQFGADVGVLTTDVEVLDGVLDIGLLQDLADNPIINAIEILKLGDVEDTTGPAAAVSMFPPSAETDPILVEITLNDLSGIDVATLDAGDIEVQVDSAILAPGEITFVGFAGNIASYSIAAPAGGWSDGASVQVTLKADEIFDEAAVPNGNAPEVAALTVNFGAPTGPEEAVAILQSAQGVDSGATYGSNVIGSADLKIMENEDDILSSNYGNNSFELENTGGKQIAAVLFDFRDALYGDSVIDTDGSSGDLVTKPFAVQSGAAASGVIATGNNNQVSLTDSYFFAGDEPTPDPDANGANGGFRGLLLRFDGSSGGFSTGEAIGFSGDMDPNSVAAIAKTPLDSGAVNGWDVGGISGAELIGSSFTVMFDDGTFATGYLGTDGSVAGATGKATQEAEPTASTTITVNGTGSGSVGTYGGSQPVIVITGTPGDSVMVTMSKGLNPATNTADGIAQDVADRLANAQNDFQVSNAGDFQSVEFTIGANGSLTLPAGTFDYTTASGDGITFDGSDYTEPFATAPMVIAATVVDSNGNPTGPVDRVYLTSNGQEVPAASGQPAFVEENGIVVIEMESGILNEDWKSDANYSETFSANIDNPGNAAGDDYIVWQGTQALNSTDNGLIEYDIEITQTGTYLFQWRSQVGQGTVSTEHNDTWVKIDADQFYGVQGDINAPASIVKPKEADAGTFPAGAINPNGSGENGFFKVYASGATNWSWSTKTSDNDGHNIYAEFDAPGTYTIQVAARSSSHAIDRMVLSHVDDWTPAQARSMTLQESSTNVINNPPAAADDSVLMTGTSVSVDVLANDGDVDGNTLSITNISAPSFGTAVVQNGEILYTASLSTGGTTTLIDTGFDAGTDGFVFVDDAFRGTNQPNYASGASGAGLGETGAGLSVSLGGIDDTNINNISGGWETGFNMAASGTALLTFDYRLEMANGYDADEASDVLVEIDGVLFGLNGDDFIDQIANGGDTGWQTVTIDLGTLTAGAHDLTLGGYNNKKTFNDEETTISFDNITLTADLPGNGGSTTPQADSFTYTISDGNGGTDTATVSINVEPVDPNAFNAVDNTVTTQSDTAILIDVLANDTGGTSPYSITSVTTPTNGTVQIQGDDILYTPNGPSAGETPIDDTFDANAGQFTFSGDLFRGTSNDAFASGSYQSAGGLTGGGLEVVIGGVNGNDITDGMSGGWSQDVTIANSSQATISFSYNMTLTDPYEANEFGQVLFAVDGTLIGTGGNDYLAQINDGGTTGWQTVTIDLGVLDANVHSFDFGAFNNQKTTADEFTTVMFDDILLTLNPISDSFEYVATDDNGETDTATVIIDFDDLGF